MAIFLVCFNSKTLLMVKNPLISLKKAGVTVLINFNSSLHLDEKSCLQRHLINVAGMHANLLEQKKIFVQEKGLTGLVCNTIMAAVSLFWNNNMADVKSRENTSYKYNKNNNNNNNISFTSMTIRSPVLL